MFFRRWSPTAWLLVIVLIIIIAPPLITEVGTHGMSRIIQTLKEWQTLATGLLAIIAALLTTRAMRTQLDFHRAEARAAADEAQDSKRLNALSLWQEAHGEISGQVLSVLEMADARNQPIVLVQGLRALINKIEVYVTDPVWLNGIQPLQASTLDMIAMRMVFKRRYASLSDALQAKNATEDKKGAESHLSLLRDELKMADLWFIQHSSLAYARGPVEFDFPLTKQVFQLTADASVTAKPTP